MPLLFTYSCYGYVDNNGTGAKQSVVVCCVFVFVGKCCCKLHYCGLGRLRKWLFSLSVFASGNIFLQPTRQLAKCCRWSRLAAFSRTHALQVICQRSVKCLKTC